MLQIKFAYQMNKVKRLKSMEKDRNQPIEMYINFALCLHDR